MQGGQTFRWTRTSGGKWIGVDGDAWFHVEVWQPGTPFQALTVESNFPLGRMETLFRLDWDDAEICRKVLQKGPELAPFLQDLPGLRILRFADSTEVLFSFLCSANNHLSRIGAMVRFLAAQGTIMDEINGHRIYQFPDVSQLAAISPGVLRQQGFGYRADTITKAAIFVEENGGAEWIRSLPSLPYEQAVGELLKIPYIGRKLADCVALFGLNHTEAVPIDTHIWKAITRLYFSEWADSALTDLKYRTASEHLRNRFGPWAGWVQQHLFLEGVQNWRSRQK